MELAEISQSDVRILAEIDTGMQFINVEFVVCTALLVFNFTALESAPTAIVALFCSMVFLLFGGLMFATANGDLARGSGTLDHARRSIEWGNLLTEWFGIYPLVFALPVVVQIVADSAVLGALALCLDLAGYMMYAFTGIDMLGRFLMGWRRLLVHAFFMAGIVVNWTGVVAGIPAIYLAGGVFFALTAVFCALLHGRRREFRSSRDS